MPPQDVVFEELTVTGNGVSLQKSASSRDRKRTALFGRFRSSKVLLSCLWQSVSPFVLLFLTRTCWQFVTDSEGLTDNADTSAWTCQTRSDSP